MKTVRRTPLIAAALFFVTILGLTVSPRTLQAQTGGTLTFYNRTPHDIWIAVAKYRRAGNNSVLGINPSSGTAGSEWPHHVETHGWFKANRYGGSVSVPHGTHVYVIGSGDRKLAGFLDGSKSFPINRGATFAFKKSFDLDEKRDPWAKGTLKQATEQAGLELQMFAPVARFPQGELTVDNLGWK